MRSGEKDSQEGDGNSEAKQVCFLLLSFHKLPMKGGILEGFSQNTDLSSTVIVHPVAIFDLLLANQDLCDPRPVDWIMAKGKVKNLSIETALSNTKVTGLSEKTCREQTFSLKQRNGPDVVYQAHEITGYGYLASQPKQSLAYSAVKNHSIRSYFPLEVVSICNGAAGGHYPICWGYNFAEDVEGFENRE